MDTSSDRYFVYENRLASFKSAQPIAKKRPSNASSRAPKALHWPHKALHPADLAKAGFFFDPAPTSPDNVTCFLCNKALDGWEEDDNPLEEHLKHSPSCGWAIMAAVDARFGDYWKLHPLEPSMIEARKATFAGRWPYDAKKSWKCKTKQLAEAGWHYTPTTECDDMATCAYCDLALDGWESGDKPFDEHYKRVPGCEFFALISQYPPIKKSRGKASKASRLSVQSVATVATAASDLGSVADSAADHDDSVVTTTSVMTQGGKKGRKKAPAKGRKTRPKKDEAVEIVEILEDAPHEVETPALQPAKSGRGRKRVSDAMEDSVVTNAEAPAPKKRATRVKGSNMVDTSIMTTVSQDTEMTDVAAPKKTAAKKKGRASTAKTARKTSQASIRSQASTASLGANDGEADDEIERQLQADLERPLTDDEGLAADSESEKKTAPAPRGRPKKAAAARKTSTQSQPHPSEGYQMFDPTPSEPNEAELDAELQKMEAEAEADQLPVEEPLVVPKKGRKAGTRKVSKQTKKTKAPPPPPSSDPIQESMDDPTPVPVPVPTPAPKEEKPEAALAALAALSVAEPANDPDASTKTVVTQPIKRGRGRPSKKSLLAQAAAEEAEKRRSSGGSAKIEVQIESTHARESLASGKATPAKVSRKPVPAPATTTATPASTTSKSDPPAKASATPARTEKSLPPPPQSASRLPRPPATPQSYTTPSANAKQATISPSQSPQSSDAENRPPSSKLTASVSTETPKRVVLAPAVATPVAGSSPSKRNAVGGLQSTTPWTAVDLDAVFSPSKEANKENGVDRLLRRGRELTSPEKRMTVEEWIFFNAEIAEQKLKHECESMVSQFENEGGRAIGVLEGIVVD